MQTLLPSPPFASSLTLPCPRISMSAEEVSATTAASVPLAPTLATPDAAAGRVHVFRSEDDAEAALSIEVHWVLPAGHGPDGEAVVKRMKRERKETASRALVRLVGFVRQSIERAAAAKAGKGKGGKKKGKWKKGADEDDEGDFDAVLVARGNADDVRNELPNV